MYHNMFWGGMWFSWIFWLIIIALIAWLIIDRVNRTNKRNSSDFEKESPMDILNKRYAKGEINKEEYEEIKKSIK